MDHLLETQQLVRSILDDFISLPNEDYPTFQEILIVDELKQHFVLFTIGWEEGSYSHLTTFHLEVKEDGDVWIHENKTDVPIELSLMEHGIAQDKIKIARLEQSFSASC